MTEASALQCTFCGAPVRTMRDGACPFCGTALLVGGAASAVPDLPPGTPAGTCAVVLREAGRNKIGVIKTIRAVTGLGLKEAKDLTESAGRGGATVVAGVDAARATTVADQLRADGATVDVVHA